MVKKFLTLGIILLNSLLFFGCSNSMDNSITFNNMSSSNILFNFRGTITQVPSGENVVIKNIPGGTYNYSMTYDYPNGASSISTNGATSGSLVIKGGTKILFLYTSNLANNTYTLNITMSDSDDQSSSTSVTGP
jgi:hypothetical protein